MYFTCFIYIIMINRNKPSVIEYAQIPEYSVDVKIITMLTVGSD
jgi:hypothetical protein